MFEELLSLPTCWEQLKKTQKPIVMYGMGNGADHILSYFDTFGIEVAEFFASDAFVRGHSFHGKRVKKLSEIEETYDDFVIVTAFAVQDAPTMDYIYGLADRYELYAPDVPVAGENLFDRDFLREHLTKAEAACALLADEESRRVYRDLLAYKLTGDVRYLKSTESPRQAAFDTLLRLGQTESYVDLGAYNGDTIEEFLQQTGGEFSAIRAMEPDEKNHRKALARMENLGLGDDARVDIRNLAAWEEKTVLHFAAKAGRNSAVAAQKEQKVREIPADSVDNLVGKNPVSYIKMDVEGSEKEAILGSANAIRRHHPKMMLSAYHRSEDLWALPLQIARICPGYRFYLRRFPYIPAWEINYICLWEDAR